jgi:hypothetical protein
MYTQIQQKVLNVVQQAVKANATAKCPGYIHYITCTLKLAAFAITSNSKTCSPGKRLIDASILVHDGNQVTRRKYTSDCVSNID